MTKPPPLPAGGAQRGADALDLVLALEQHGRPGKRGRVHAPIDRRAPGPRNVRGSMSGDVPDVRDAGRTDHVPVARTHPQSEPAIYVLTA